MTRGNFLSMITALLATFVIMILPYPSAAASFMSGSGVSEDEYNAAVKILTERSAGKLTISIVFAAILLRVSA